MRIILLVILSSFYFNMYSQSEEAKNKILLVQENLEQVPPYSCEIKIKIDIGQKLKEGIKNKYEEVKEAEMLLERNFLFTQPKAATRKYLAHPGKQKSFLKESKEQFA